MDKQPFFCARFYVTHDCNSRCSFCDTHDRRYRCIKSMSRQESLELIDQLYAVGCRYIDFTGGEPTLCPHLPELIAHAKALGIKTEVTTNGVNGIGEDGELRPVLKSCAELADKFNISLDTLDPKAYARIRGVDRLETVQRVISKLNWRRLKLMMVITPENADQLEPLLKYAAQQHCSLYINPVFTYSDGTKDPCASDYLDVLQRCFFTPSAIILLHFLEFYRSSHGYPVVPCSANRQTLTVAANGDLFLPCYHAADREQLSRSDGLEQALHSPQFLACSEQAGRLPVCKNCTVTPYFGISFSYRLDRYALLQNISEKVSHLKQLTDPHAALLRCDPALNDHLSEYLRIVRSLNTDPCCEKGALYSAHRLESGLYVTDVYRAPLSQEEYEQELSAQDVWALPRMPHHFFDQVKENVYRPASECLASGRHIRLAAAVLEQAFAFTIRWWKLYVSLHMSVDITCNIQAEFNWLTDYFNGAVRDFCEAASLSAPAFPKEIATV